MTMKIKMKYKKALSFLIALCIVAGLIPLMSPPAQATTTGRWEVYVGTTAANARLHSTTTNLRDAFNVYNNSNDRAFVRIHHIGSNQNYDLGATNPGFNVHSNRTLALTGNACTYWSGTGNSHIFHLTGGTLYVGRNITLEKRNTWSAVGATSGTSTLYNFGTIRRQNNTGHAIHIDSGRRLNYFSWVSSSTGAINNQGTHNRTILCTLTLSAGTGVSSVNFPAHHHDLPFQLEGFRTFNRPTSGTTTVNIPEPAYATGYGAPHSPASFAMTTSSTTFSHTITAAAKTYTLTFSRPGATTAGGASRTATFMNAALSGTAWNAPTRTGYTFDGYWTTASGTGSRVVSATGALIASVSGYTDASRRWIRDGNVTLHARWTTHNYSVRFNPNGGSGTMANQAFTYDTARTLTANAFTRTGHTFVGWNTAANGSGTAYTNSQNVSNLTAANNGIVDLHAQWEINPLETNIVVNDTTDNFTVDGDNLMDIFDNPVENGATGVTEEEMRDGNTITITLTVSETDDETAPGANDILNTTRGRMLQFFDITVEKTVVSDRTVTTRLRELPVPIQVIIDLSQEMSGRTGYTVYRFHDGEVQLLGMDVSDGEYYEISRETGRDGVDQVIINTRRFSTFAVVENILTITGEGSGDVDVQARIIEVTSPVYKIDIEWGDMKFVYNLASRGTWNNRTHRYDNPTDAEWDASGFEDGNNQITVTNHSNADVRVSFSAENNFDDSSDVKIALLTANDENGVPATNLPLGKVPRQHDDALKVYAYLRLDGEPSEEDIARLNADIWHRVGIITVTITPDGDDLTPLR